MILDGIHFFLFVFFFQAEDGIRDYKVTGVQTCALPILAAHRAREAVEVAIQGALELARGQGAIPLAPLVDRVLARFRHRRRSEERRVGKECSCLWSSSYFNNIYGGCASTVFTCLRCCIV